jgi:hypothetical protein
MHAFYLLFVLLFWFPHACSEPGFVFDKACLLSYNHMSFGGGPLEVGTEEEAEKLTSQNEKDSANGNNYAHATSSSTPCGGVWFTNSNCNVKVMDERG